jgi:ribosomal-protein-alanine N-acetyltransferase
VSAGVELASGGLADLPAVMTVMEAAFEARFGEAWTAPQCAGLLPMGGVWLTLARTDGAPVGFSMARMVAGEAELLLLAVHPGARGRGIGKSLVEHFLAAASARGAERFYLEVRDGNAALNLYNASGFQIVGRRRGYYSGRDGSNYDALTLSRPANLGGRD